MYGITQCMPATTNHTIKIYGVSGDFPLSMPDKFDISVAFRSNKLSNGCSEARTISITIQSILQLKRIQLKVMWWFSFQIVCHYAQADIENQLAATGVF